MRKKNAPLCVLPFIWLETAALFLNDEMQRNIWNMSLSLPHEATISQWDFCWTAVVCCLSAWCPFSKQPPGPAPLHWRHFAPFIRTSLFLLKKCVEILSRLFGVWICFSLCSVQEVLTDACMQKLARTPFLFAIVIWWRCLFHVNMWKFSDYPEIKLISFWLDHSALFFFIIYFFIAITVKYLCRLGLIIYHHSSGKMILCVSESFWESNI